MCAVDSGPKAPPGLTTPGRRPTADALQARPAAHHHHLAALRAGVALEPQLARLQGLHRLHRLRAPRGGPPPCGPRARPPSPPRPRAPRQAPRSAASARAAGLLRVQTSALRSEPGNAFRERGNQELRQALSVMRECAGLGARDAIRGIDDGYVVPLPLAGELRTDLGVFVALGAGSTARLSMFRVRGAGGRAGRSRAPPGGSPRC